MNETVDRTDDRTDEDPPTSTRPGADARKPTQLPAEAWKQILLRVKEQTKSDNVVLLGAGVAFFALLAIVPAFVAIVSIYGLVAEPSDVQRQVEQALSAAPTEVQELLSDQLTTIVESNDSSLGLGAVLGIALALWSASSGMKHLISAINAAYDEEEGRGFLALRGTALALTLGAIVATIVAVGLIAILPAVLRATGMGSAGQLAVTLVRWPLLGGLMLAGLAVLYRYAPDRDDPRWSWSGLGSIFAVVGFLVASLLFSFYTANFASFGETYGSLGSIIVVMLWLMISATVVIVGAELNAEAERQTDRDSTVGEPEPQGHRGAYAADVPPDRDTKES